MAQSLNRANNKRNSSIELLKLIAVLLIICSSSLPFGVTYVGGHDDVYVNLNNTQFSATHIIFTLFRWFGQIGDTLFIVCSAWFLCDSRRFKLNKAAKMVADSWIISVVGLIAALLLLSPTVSEIIKSLFPVTFQMNWFVGCYIIYYLIHPLLNKAVEDLNDKAFRRFVIILFVAYSVVGTALKLYYFTNLVAFICIHYFVSYYKRYGRDKLSQNKDYLIVSVSAAVIIGWIVCVNYLGERISIVSTKNLFGCTFINPIIVLLGIAALDLAVRKEFHNRAINAIAKYSLLIYLFHANYFWLTYGKYHLQEALLDLGIGRLGIVLIVIAIYSVATVLLSAAYEISAGKVTAALSVKIAAKDLSCAGNVK
ncbi:MAG: acyltransferase [Bacillota bacterium]|nr:acyltransferase [Bacillota bacterium]